MPIMYPPRAKGRALNVHPGQVERMLARGWALEPFHDEQRVETPAKLTGAQRAAIRGGATYEPPAPRSRGEGGKPKRRSTRLRQGSGGQERKDADR